MLKKSMAFTLVLIMAFSLSACAGKTVSEDNRLMNDLRNIAGKVDLEDAASNENAAGGSSSGGILGGLIGSNNNAQGGAASGGGQNGAQGDGANPFAQLTGAQYAQVLQSGQYYIKYIGYVMGMEMTGETAMQGGNMDTIGEVFGFKTHTLVLDGKSYEIDDVAKTYAVSEAVDASSAASSGAMDYSGLYYKGNGSGTIASLDEMEIDSNSYNYEEFGIKIDTSKGGLYEGASKDEIEILEATVMRFYYDGDQLYAITANMMGMEIAMVIEELSGTIPGTMLRLPDGYTQVESIY